MRPLARTFLLGLTLLLVAVAPAFSQKGAPKKEPKKKVDPVLAVIERAEKAMAEGRADDARKAYEEAFKMDKSHRHDAANVGLATFLLDDQIKAGTRFKLTREQLVQRFTEVPYLAQGFCQIRTGDAEGAKRAWHNIVEWRGSDELVQYLNELNLDSEVKDLKSEMGIDSGTGIGAQKALEEKYAKENKWEGAFELARKRLREIPVGSKAELGIEAEKLTRTCTEYFFKQANAGMGLKRMAAELYQRTEDHQRVLFQIINTKQVGKTSLVRVHPLAEAEVILKKRIESLASMSAYLETLAGNPEAPVAAGAVEVEPPENAPDAPAPPPESVAP
jgi:hypothetical protein